jgi:NADPH-dependent 2,4-dienoyl-CoA reductase/sulfur reductase-like enzyme
MPHVIPRANAKRKIVVVGAGPAGLEAARVGAARGHEVIVFEAAGEPGGQVRLTARSPARRDMLSIIDWRVAQCEAQGVGFRFNAWAEAAGTLDENPDVVIVATRRPAAYRNPRLGQ